MSVIKVTDAELENQLSQSPKVVIKFYADWCGSCKLFAPKFKRLSQDERFLGMAFLEINAEENPTARQLATVSNLPFFAFFQDGKLVGTVATSKEDALVEFLNNQN